MCEMGNGCIVTRANHALDAPLFVKFNPQSLQIPPVLLLQDLDSLGLELCSGNDTEHHKKHVYMHKQHSPISSSTFCKWVCSATWYLAEESRAPTTDNQ